MCRLFLLWMELRNNKTLSFHPLSCVHVAKREPKREQQQEHGRATLLSTLMPVHHSCTKIACLLIYCQDRHWFHPEPILRHARAVSCCAWLQVYAASRSAVRNRSRHDTTHLHFEILT